MDGEFGHIVNQLVRYKRLNNKAVTRLYQLIDSRFDTIDYEEKAQRLYKLHQKYYRKIDQLEMEKRAFHSPYAEEMNRLKFITTLGTAV
jgi:hypothetical protein